MLCTARWTTSRYHDIEAIGPGGLFSEFSSYAITITKSQIEETARQSSVPPIVLRSLFASRSTLTSRCCGTALNTVFIR